MVTEAKVNHRLSPMLVSCGSIRVSSMEARTQDIRKMLIKVITCIDFSIL